MRLHPWIWFSLRCFVSVVFLFLLINAVDLGVVSNYVAHIGWTPFVVSTSVFLVALFINTVRWHILLVIQGGKVSLLQLFFYNLANAFYVVVLPGGKMSAELVRMYQIVSDSPDPHAAVRAASAAFIDRIIGFSVFVVIVVLFFLFHPSIVANVSPGFLFTTGGIGVLAFFSAFLISPTRLLGFLQFWIPSLQQFSVSELGGKYRTRLGLLVVTFVLSVAASITFALGVYAAAYALSLPLSYEIALVSYSIGMISSFVPITLGGIGLREGALVSALVALAGISVEAAAVISFVMLFASLATAVLGGLVELNRHFMKKTL